MSFRSRWAGWVFHDRPPPTKAACGWWQYAYVMPGAMVAMAVWMALSNVVPLAPSGALSFAAGFAWGFPVYFTGGTLSLAANTRGIPLKYLGAIAALGFGQIPLLAILFRIEDQSPPALSPAWLGIGFMLGIAMAFALIGTWVHKPSGDAGKPPHTLRSQHAVRRSSAMRGPDSGGISVTPASEPRLMFFGGVVEP